MTMKTGMMQLLVSRLLPFSVYARTSTVTGDTLEHAEDKPLRREY
ncbi:hypothetical protein [Xenorhabdus mauleonii]|nr:hypothetical protein [Xenorhabdus mauleonii]